MKRAFIAAACALSIAGAAWCSGAAAQARKQLIVSEPIHSTGFLPMYAAIRNGYFAEEGLDIRMTVVDTGSGHTNAVLSGQAFAFIGGPEHNAFAKLKGGELRTVVGVVDRGMVYPVSRKGEAPAPGQSLKDFVRGKRIAVGFYSSTPNSVARYLIKTWGLDVKKDVTLLEMTNSAVIAPVKAGTANFAVTTEPLVTRGIRQGVWSEPFYNVPKELGPYAYSTLNVRLASIREDPETVRKFVRGVVRGLKFTYDKPDEILAVAKKEFPAFNEADLKATIDRSFADAIWNKDGFVSPQSWKTGEAVVRAAGILKQDVAYDQIIDMQFVKATGAGAK
jgi:NitT/TauT family transport system substrate-binding protein